MKQFRILVSVLIFAFALLSSACATATPTPAPSTAEPLTTPAPGATAVPAAALGSPVVVNGKILFYVRARVGSITPEDRARIISQRIETIARNPFRTNLQVKAVDSDAGTDLYIENDLILTVTDADARTYGMSRSELAGRAAELLQQEMGTIRKQFSVEAQTRGVIQTLVLLAAIVLLLWLVNRIYHRLERALNESFTKAFEKRDAGEPLRYASQPLRLVLLFLLRVARIALWLLILIVLLPLVLSFFPETRELYNDIVELIREPLIAVWEGFVAFLPNLFFILVFTVIALFVIRFLRAFFDQIEKGTIRLGGFEADWAPLTKNLVTLLLIALTLVIIFPYIPFSDAPAFQGVSIFLGLLFTLSSSSVISNMIAGIMLTYNGAFHVGDLVQLGSTIGTVVEKRLFTTRVRTFKNEEVSIPNSVVIGASIQNYSVLAAKQGLILHTEITIGYEAPWRQVHQLMIDAAKATEGISAEPAPYVLQRALNDWHVTYEINAFTHEPEQMPRIMSALMSNLQDKFNEAGVEIMSPSFYALRDGNTVTIPEAQRPADYQVPAFRVAIEPRKQ